MKRAAAIARAYNNRMADFVEEDPMRLYGAGLIAPTIRRSRSTR